MSGEGLVLRILAIGAVIVWRNPCDAIGIKPEMTGEVPNQLDDLGNAARNHRHPQLDKKRG